jgi:hypothetical protein
MYEKILKLKQEKSWLFYLLIIPFLVLGAIELYNKYLVNSGKRIVDKAEEKDKELEVKQKEAVKKAEEYEEKAKENEEKAKNNKVDKNWHLK